MFNRKKDEEFFQDTNDLLIVFDDEKKTSEIRTISHYGEDGSIKVLGPTGYSIPIEDCEITNSEEGRNFFYRAPTQSIKETQRLAQLEKSIVLSQITQYRPKEPEEKGNGLTFFLLSIIVFAFLMMGISSCSA